MGRNAEKLLERMRRQPAGWGQDDFRTLYEGFGFTVEEGANHTTYVHGKFSQLRTQVPRHRQVKPYCSRIACDLIDELKVLEEQEES